MYLSYQDYEKSGKRLAFIGELLDRHITTPEYGMARQADLYDRCRNTGIGEFYEMYDRVNGAKHTSVGRAIRSNYFARLNTQRSTYSLGNGVTFPAKGVKEKLGDGFDEVLQRAGYFALIHGVSFLMLNRGHCHVFRLTEFCPLYDEENGALRAGVQFWRIHPSKPLQAVLYEEDGFTRLVSGSEFHTAFKAVGEKQAYITRYETAEADEEPEVIGVENYSFLPIVPLYGSYRKQSTLAELKSKIDNYDLVLSGFADTVQKCADIYWLVENYGGMRQEDLDKFLRNLSLHRIAEVDTTENGKIQPYVQEVPTEARQALLAALRAQIFEDFGALDVHALAAGSTNDHLQAAYQPMDENADDFEGQIIECVKRLLQLAGVEGTDAVPQFKRNRISNQKEQVEMVMQEAAYLDDATVLALLPNITPDQIEAILQAREEQEKKQDAYGGFPGFAPKGPEA